MGRYKSRAKRYDEATSAMDTARYDAQAALQEIVEGRNVKDAPDPGEKEKVEKIVDDFLTAWSEGIGEINELKDEMESWRDNMSSANMEHLPKYEEVDECVNELENALGELEDPSIDVEDATQASSEIEGLDPNGYSPNFPGMYS